MFNRLFRPFVTSGRPIRQAMPGPLQDLVDAYAPIRHDPLPRNSGYVLITSRDNEDEAYLGRNLEFDSNRGLFGRGQPERVILDGHVIYETQLRNTSKSKLKSHFMDLYRISRVSHAQVADIIAEDDDVEMFGQTEKMNQAFDREFDELRAEMEMEYAERFEEDYQERFAQEYPGKFSADFEKHYTDMVQDELDDSVESHEDLYHEYIVTPKHIRYKR